MLLQFFYDEKLAQASYLVGCQAYGEAVVVDPARNIEPYIAAAEKEGLKLTGVLETHIHADYVSGARELSHRLGATLYVSDEGDADWKYEYVSNVGHQLVKDGDTIQLGNLTFEVMHTPGHTPESISFLLTDGGANADEPIGIFTGDFVFVGDIGRPDLLEQAAGIENTAVPGAKAMFQSLKRFKELPDFMQVWPAHGAGSACGKSLGAVPASTVGYEKRFNWAFKYDNESAFIDALLEGQPEAPKYFAVMKHVNKVGPTLLEDIPEVREITSFSELEKLITNGEQVIDTRNNLKFANKHIPGTINIQNTNSFPNWAGWLVDYDRPLYLLADPNEMEEILEALHSVGADNAVAFMDVDAALAAAERLENYEWINPNEAEEKINQSEVNILDVRNLTEWEEHRLENATHIMLGKLPDHVDKIQTDKPLLVLCGSGGRSAIAASILQAHGIKEVYNLTGGMDLWVSENRIVAD